MKRKLLGVLIITAGVCFHPGVLGQEAAPPPLLKRIEINGNKRIPEDTIRYYLRSQVNQPLNPATVERDFRSLLKLGPFENVTVEEKSGDRDAILVFKVEERPFISEIEYEGVQPPTVEKIKDLLQAKKIDLRVNAPYDPGKAYQAERLIERMLEQEGFASAHAHVVAEAVNPATVKLAVKISKGTRTKVEAIVFEGNSAFADATLRAQMRLVKQKSLTTLISRKDIFSRARVDEDLQRVTQYYQEHGYARVQVGEPRIEVVKGPLKAATTPKSWANAKRLNIIIPLQEGEVYHIESVARNGKPTSYEGEIEPELSRIKPGDIYNAKQLQDTYNAIKKVLGSHGYLVMNPSVDQIFDEDKKAVKVTFNLNEIYPFYVRKVEFEGHRRIPDKMLRRDIKFNEGDPFNEAILDRSLIQLNRSGLVEDVSRQQVDLKLDKEEREVDIVIRLKERPRQGLWFTGGSSGLGGGYSGAIYSALNLLGLGEILGVELTGGTRNYNMAMDMVARSLFGSKFTLGFSLFRRFMEFPVLGSQGSPAGLVSRVTRGSFGGSLTGSYALSEVTKVDLAVQSERITSNLPSPGLLNARALSRRALAPAFSFDTTNHLQDPHHGQKLILGAAYSGGWLGGDVHTVRPTLEYKIFRADPLSGRRNTWAFRGLVSHARGLGGREVPLYERFFSDGEIFRGFDIGQVSPMVFYPDGTSYSTAAVGGDLLTAFNAEYRVPLSETFSFAYFLDAGLTSILRDPRNLIAGQNLSLIRSTNSVLRLSTGGELKMQLPMINRPIRFVFAINPLRLRQSFIAPDGRLFGLREPRSRTRVALGNSF